MLLFKILGVISAMLGLDSVLDESGLMLALLILAMLPAILLAAWQTGKPSLRRGPPE